MCVASPVSCSVVRQVVVEFSLVFPIMDDAYMGSLKQCRYHQLHCQFFVSSLFCTDGEQYKKMGCFQL